MALYIKVKYSEHVLAKPRIKRITYNLQLMLEVVYIIINRIQNNNSKLWDASMLELYLLLTPRAINRLFSTRWIFSF